MRTLMLRILAAAVVVGLAAGLSYGQSSIGAGLPKTKKAKPGTVLTYATILPDGAHVELTLQDDGRLELIERKGALERRALAVLDDGAKEVVAAAANDLLATPIRARPGGRRLGVVSLAMPGRPASRTLGAVGAEARLGRVLDEIVEVVREGALADHDDAAAAAAVAAPIVPILPRGRRASG